MDEIRHIKICIKQIQNPKEKLRNIIDFVNLKASLSFMAAQLIQNIQEEKKKKQKKTQNIQKWRI